MTIRILERWLNEPYVVPKRAAARTRWSVVLNCGSISEMVKVNARTEAHTHERTANTYQTHSSLLHYVDSDSVRFDFECKAYYSSRFTFVCMWIFELTDYYLFISFDLCCFVKRWTIFFSFAQRYFNRKCNQFQCQTFLSDRTTKKLCFFWIRLIKLESCIGAGGSQNRVPLTCDCVAVGQKCTWRLWNVVKRHNTFYWFLVEKIAFHRNFTCILCAIDKLMQLWDYRL